MKRNVFTLFGLVALSVVMCACSGVNRLIKGGDPEQIYAKGVELYDAEKWSKAITLLEHVENYYSGTSKADTLSFYIARAHFKNRNYDTASELFDKYRRTFGRSPFLEASEGMYAMCFYYMAPSAERDQTVTGQAIIAISEFMSRYPNSEKYDDFKKLRDELTERLYDKEYLNAYTYYKIGRQKSAIVALKNALKKYPDSPHREELMYLTVSSGYELAHNSIQRKQTDRYLSMLDSYYSFIAEFPESTYRREVDKMAKEAKDYLAKNQNNDTQDGD
jgi:outer membrane protein assembly factor BamD